jgi:hypothetical protein
MAKNARLSPNKLAKEKGYFANLKLITDYDPRKAEYEVAAIQPVINRLENSLEREAQLLAELAEVRDLIAEDSTTFVEKNDGAALQVAAQYGEDSPEYQSLGRTRKSERRTGGRRGPVPTS